jgi:hypothetical protein
MAFPPVRTLIMAPAQWASIDAFQSIEATVGTLYDETEYPLLNLVDNKTQAMCRFATVSAGIKVTFGDPRPLKILGLFNHNLDPHLLIEVYVDDVLLPRTFGVQYPHCWIDLRGFSDTPTDAEASLTATTVEVRVYGNSRPVALSEFAAGDAYIFDGLMEVPFPEVYGTTQQRVYTDAQVTKTWGSGAHVRLLTLQLQVSADALPDLQAVMDAVEEDERVIVVPSSRINQIWLAHWPAQLNRTYTASDRVLAVPLELIEDTMGVLP